MQRYLERRRRYRIRAVGTIHTLITRRGVTVPVPGRSRRREKGEMASMAVPLVENSSFISRRQIWIINGTTHLNRRGGEPQHGHHISRRYYGSRGVEVRYGGHEHVEVTEFLGAAGVKWSRALIGADALPVSERFA